MPNPTRIVIFWWSRILLQSEYGKCGVLRYVALSANVISVSMCWTSCYGCWSALKEDVAHDHLSYLGLTASWLVTTVNRNLSTYRHVHRRRRERRTGRAWRRRRERDVLVVWRAGYDDVTATKRSEAASTTSDAVFPHLPPVAIAARLPWSRLSIYEKYEHRRPRCYLRHFRRHVWPRCLHSRFVHTGSGTARAL